MSLSTLLDRLVLLVESTPSHGRTSTQVNPLRRTDSTGSSGLSPLHRRTTSRPAASATVLVVTTAGLVGPAAETSVDDATIVAALKVVTLPLIVVVVSIWS